MADALHSLFSPVLDATTENALIDAVQDPTTPKAAEADAWDRLIAAHHRAIIKSARSTTRIDFDDAYSEAMVTFVDVVKSFDTSIGFRLSTVAHVQMTQRVADLARSESSPIKIPARVVGYYYALLRKAEEHPDAATLGLPAVAFRMAQDGGHSISPSTFMAVHRAISEHMDADSILGSGATPYHAHSAELTGESGNITSATIREFGYTPEPMGGSIDREYVASLLAACSPEQRRVVEVAYGFDEVAVETLREKGILQAGHGSAIMSDRLVGGVVGRSRQAVERFRTRGLEAMRGYVQSAVNTDADV